MMIGVTKSIFDFRRPSRFNRKYKRNYVEVDAVLLIPFDHFPKFSESIKHQSTFVAPNLICL